MKRIALLIVGIVALGGVLTFGPQMAKDRTTLYEAVEPPQTVEIEKEVPTLEMRVKSAQEAELEATEAVAQVAYDEAFNQAMLEIELSVTAQYKDEIEAREIELEKEVGVY